MSAGGKTVCKSPADNLNFLHGLNTQHYRDSNPMCSTHVVVDSGTGKVVESHIDQYNPNFNLLSHLTRDVIPDLTFDITKFFILTGQGMYIFPAGRDNCH